jgi:RecJ-like exonuclease
MRINKMKNGDIVTCSRCQGEGKIRWDTPAEYLDTAGYNYIKNNTFSRPPIKMEKTCETCKGSGKLKIHLEYVPFTGEDMKSFMVVVTSCKECPHRRPYKWGSDCVLNKLDWPIPDNRLDSIPEGQFGCPMLKGQ